MRKGVREEEDGRKGRENDVRREGGREGLTLGQRKERERGRER